MVSEQFKAVQDNVIKACERSGRPVQAVTLIAVSKTKPVSMLEEAYAAGAREFGENKVQEILEKKPVLPDDICWHMIGHLQRNKVKQLIGKTRLIHSVDSLRLAKTIEEESAKQNLVTDVLLEVNVAREESKYGFFTEQVEEALRAVSQYPHVHVCGLMTIAPFVEIAEENRQIFRELFHLSVDMKSKNIDNVSMDVLSMGMSGDYEVAIEEGATMVRVGTSIFGSR